MSINSDNESSRLVQVRVGFLFVKKEVRHVTELKRQCKLLKIDTDIPNRNDKLILILTDANMNSTKKVTFLACWTWIRDTRVTCTGIKFTKLYLLIQGRYLR